MNKIVGSTICWLLRRHKWRRPYKSEINNPLGAFTGYKVCARCGIRRGIKVREVLSFSK